MSVSDTRIPLNADVVVRLWTKVTLAGIIVRRSHALNRVRIVAGRMVLVRTKVE
jgi:hypothetical protein